MTAEVAVLNKQAVALAADSAVTVSRGGHGERKTYSVNKLFSLSKHHPVGVMIYDNAELLGVPWETLIKSYRQQLGTRSFRRTVDYAEDFLRFLSRNRTLFPAKLQRNRFEAAVGVLYGEIASEAVEEMKSKAGSGEKLTGKQMKEILEETIDRWAKGTKDIDPHDCGPGFHQSLRRAYAKEISTAISDSFSSGVPLSRKAIAQLRTMAVNMTCSKLPPLGQTGVVIAGFGQNDTFPSIWTYTVRGLLLNKLLYEQDYDRSYQTEGLEPVPVAVIPFAQTDVVATFVNGVHPEFLQHIVMAFDKLVKMVPDLIPLDGISEKTVNALRKKIDANGGDVVKEISRKLAERMRKDQVDPLLETVSVLPKDELAAVASALVELTAVKRKVSRGIQTVEGPVDVAVISKGDGFVWISRKHYFRPELNPQFMKSYLER